MTTESGSPKKGPAPLVIGLVVVGCGVVILLVCMVGAAAGVLTGVVSLPFVPAAPSTPTLTPRLGVTPSILVMPTPTQTPLVVPPTPTQVPTLAVPTPTPLPPTVSPQPAARLIAYVMSKPPFGPQELRIWTMRPDGSGAKQFPVAGTSEPAFSPDGRRLVYYHWEDGLWVANLDGTNAEHIVRNTTVARPRWSPDGKKIAFYGRHGPSGNLYIFTVNPDGSDERQVTAGKEPTWSPDSKRIAYSTCINSTCGIYVVNAAGGTPTRLTDDVGSEPAWSPDGTKIAYQANADIWIMNPDGGNRRRLTTGTGNEGLPAWSPDSRSIYYLTDQNRTAWAMYVMDANGSNQHKVIDIVADPDNWGWHSIAVTK